MTYTSDIANTGTANHHWTSNNTSNDAIGSQNYTLTSGATHDATPISTSSERTHSLLCSDNTEYADIGNAATINSANFDQRTWGGWFMIDHVVPRPCAIWSDGGTQANCCVALGPGNLMFAQVIEDGSPPPTGAHTVQIFGFVAALSRPYHTFVRWSGSNDNNLMDFFIDGVKQTVAIPSDRQPDAATMFPHTAGCRLGLPAQDINIGGSTIAMDGNSGNQYMADWAMWFEEELSDADILFLFRQGAQPDTIISSGTESAMQTACDALTSLPDYPLCLEIEALSGGGDLELTLDDVDFDPLASLHIRYIGSDTLTLNLTGTTNADPTKFYSENGTIEVQVQIEVHAIDSTSANVNGARVYLTTDTGGPLPYQATVTSITRSASTATVTHTAHGMRTGDVVFIEGANQDEYNGKHTITVTAANTYTYTVSGTPTSPATGTILSTLVLIDGTTDSNGLVSSARPLTADQPVRGRVRKGTSTPFYKTTTIQNQTADSENGVTIPVLLLTDE